MYAAASAHMGYYTLKLVPGSSTCRSGYVSLIQSAWDNIAELDDLHHFESDAEHFEFIDSLLADNNYMFALAECVEGGVRCPNLMLKTSTAAKEWPASTLLPGGSNPPVYLRRITLLCEYPQYVCEWIL
jgi:hypothetical protein